MVEETRESIDAPTDRGLYANLALTRNFQRVDAGRLSDGRDASGALSELIDYRLLHHHPGDRLACRRRSRKNWLRR